MARIEYIGKKDITTDPVGGTGTVWYGTGDVQEVTDEVAVQKLLRHSGSWRLAEDAPTTKKADKPAKDQTPPPAVALIGTDKLPAVVDITETQGAQLGDIVAGAQANSGLSAEEWNALEQEERDELIQAHLESVRASFAAAPPAATKPAAKKAPAKK